MSFTASIVAIAVMLMRILSKKGPKIFSYALLGVVIFRLVFPFSIEGIFSLMPATFLAAHEVSQEANSFIAHLFVPLVKEA